MRTLIFISLVVSGLRFEEIAEVEVWHSDVRAFSVFDLSSSERLGYFYLDLHPRLAFLFFFFSITIGFL